MTQSRILWAPVVFLLASSPSPVSASEAKTKSHTPIDSSRYLNEYRRPEEIPFPSENAHRPERELLGRTLFFDPRLSGSNFISCTTCHNAGFSWQDGLAKATGHGMKELGRRTPTLLNLAWAESFFWDGRAETLEEQCLGPIQAEGEMNQNLNGLVSELVAVPEYLELFENAYPGEPISHKTLARAIATFERTLVSGRAPFDRWVGGDEAAISPEAKRGFLLFNTKARCAQCHMGWRFTDDSFHDIGATGDDIGRGKILPDLELMQYAFKTPTLRNVDRRYPYMHDGSEKTLADVIELYDLGGRVKRPALSSLIKPLALSREEKAELLAFLRTLTSVDRPVEVPRLPR